MVHVTLQQGDITLVDADAIVNAANSGLLGGGGVDGAIHAAGGPEIRAACEHLRATSLQRGLPTGEAVATTAGRLAARHVIHVVGPVYDPADDRSALLRSAYTRALQVADELGASSVAFPAISAGVYGWPLDDAAHLAVTAVLAADTRVAQARFVLFDDRAYRAFSAALAAATRR
ncbi:O-acetyl-ADP-ribose deacetylase [Candidatus Frankia alpina]|uniref:O-acetyl-ADP-ribose deacetylase n=1 Tax=Candidatus Frankia alpina TaxID=2699483 RepID=A0A4S5ET26_9ACTN|nr:O-acetyl-ADP-ribose deacetylase [Candidatus Frankia alpina]THJ75685.1 O-acetyl-ADP-ribose deacetylase [Candidatus Frankia alpina]